VALSRVSGAITGSESVMVGVREMGNEGVVPRFVLV